MLCTYAKRKHLCILLCECPRMYNNSSGPDNLLHWWFNIMEMQTPRVIKKHSSYLSYPLEHKLLLFSTAAPWILCRQLLVIRLLSCGLDVKDRQTDLKVPVLKLKALSHRLALLLKLRWKHKKSSIMTCINKRCVSIHCQSVSSDTERLLKTSLIQWPLLFFPLFIFICHHCISLTLCLSHCSFRF